MPPYPAAFQLLELLAFLSVFTLLVRNAAAGLAGRLAGGLAFAATTVLGAVTQIAGFNRLDMFHNFTFSYWNG